MKYIVIAILLLTLFINGNEAPSKIVLAIDCYTQEGYIAALSEKYLDDVIRYSIDKDYVALQKLFDAGVAIKMKKGVKVHLVKTHLFAGKVEFRIPGYTEILWTVTEGIKC